MNALSESLLQSLGTWLQWISITGMSLGLISGVGLFFVSGEISDRQERKLSIAQTDASSAKKLADDLQNKLKPREISDAQRTKFINALKESKKGTLSVYSFVNADPGTIQFANQVRDMVVAAGFGSGKMVGMSLISGPIPIGEGLRIKDESNPPQFAGIVQRAFSEIGIPLDGYIDPSLPADELRIVIGLKP